MSSSGPVADSRHPYRSNAARIKHMAIVTDADAVRLLATVARGGVADDVPCLNP